MISTAQSRARILARALPFIFLFIAAASFAAEPPGNPAEVYGPRFSASSVPIQQEQVERRSSQPVDGLRYWNQLAIDASGLDHTPVSPGEARKFGEQLGPGRAARAMAIVHIAMFDAVNSILGGYRSYTQLPRATRPASLNAAIAAAAHDTLVAMFPSQQPQFDARYAADIGALPGGAGDTQVRNGVAIGKRAAALILARRASDGSAGADPQMGSEWMPSEAAGRWRQDPISLSPIAMGAHWGKVKPFVLRSASQFRTPPPPAMTSATYARAFEEVKRLGGDPVHTPTKRTEEQEFIGNFWAYDGTPSLCAPPRLYNQLVTTVSRNNSDVLAMARLYALTNVAMADAGIAIWESKYYYDFWRPVTGIREADAGTGPSGTGDGNPGTVGDATFWPIGAPASNLTAAGFTPPFPSYPSGHAGFGGALFEMLRNVYGTDRRSFTFISDEYNGVTTGSDGVVRPLRPRRFEYFSQAEEENGQSRIYLGIHWSFDKTEGIRQGRRIADYVYANAFQKIR
jgi:hypothetical protein